MKVLPTSPGMLSSCRLGKYYIDGPDLVVETGLAQIMMPDCQFHTCTLKPSWSVFQATTSPHKITSSSSARFNLSTLVVMTGRAARGCGPSWVNEKKCNRCSFLWYSQHQ